jgi:hypothetical protein
MSVTDRGGLDGCDMSRILHFLAIRLTGGGEVVSLTGLPQFTFHEDS